jgi:hypothetical protein
VKLGISRQALSQRAAKRKRELPMGTPEAVYTIAFDQGVDISNYLSVEETEAVRKLVAQLHVRQGRTESSAAPRRGLPLSSPTSKPTFVSLAGVKVEPIFGRRSWFEELVNDLNVSRRVVAHMNPGRSR